MSKDQSCPLASQAVSEPATSTERAGELTSLVVLGRVPVFGKIVRTERLCAGPLEPEDVQGVLAKPVASERASTRQPAEQIAAEMRESGLEVEIRPAC